MNYDLKKKSNTNKPLIAFLIIVLILGLLGICYFIFI